MSKPGLPIVMLPGMHGTGDLLRDLQQRLAQRRPAHVIELPQVGPQSYDELVGHVTERLPEGSLVVLGESFAGPIAIEIASRFPGRAAGLVLASTFARRPLHPLLARAVPFVDHHVLPSWLFERLMLGRGASAELRTGLRSVVATLPTITFRGRALAALGVDKTKMLSSIRCPTLCLLGRKDRLISRRRMDEITAGIRGAELVELDAPHMLLETHAREAAAAIEAFCARIETTRPA